MLKIAYLVAFCCPSLAHGSLLPLRIDLPAPRAKSSYGHVTNTAVAVGSVNDRDGTIIHNKARHPDDIEPSKSIAITPMLAHARLPHETGGTVNMSSIAVTSIDSDDGILVDYYKQYTGNGTIREGWPKKSSWISFSDLFESNKYFFSQSCNAYHQSLNSAAEISALHDAIQDVALRTLVDHRFILAIIVQESGGCVRAPTSNYGIPNPGVMQDHNGTATCNDGANESSILNPCPAEMILKMIEEGAGGTEWGDGLAQCINLSGSEDVSAFYRAARIYNSGSLHESGDLGKGVATHCYASDIANRLTGWVRNEHRCELDP